MDLNTLKVQYNIFNGVLKDLYEHYGFLSDVEEGFTEGYLDKFSCEFDCNYNDLEIEIKWGVTKAVICLPNNEWVLKIPFSDYEFDYCSLEEKNYISAKREGFEDFMAETHYLMDFNGSPCYIMKKADIKAIVKNLNSFSFEKFISKSKVSHIWSAGRSIYSKES